MQHHLSPLLGILIFASAGFVQHGVSGFGFPDGHRTELERAYTELWDALLAPVLVLGMNFLALGVVARHRPVRVWLWVSVAFAVALMFGGVAVALTLHARFGQKRRGVRRVAMSLLP